MVDKEFATGKGNWKHFNIDLAVIETVAKEWSAIFEGIQKPWLCWNVDPEWCLVQQKLVQSVGWTPVVGGDPRSKPSILIDGAVGIDFNKHFNLPMMHFLFVAEFSYLFCDKLAFWHSDFIIKEEKIKKIASIFDGLRDGDMCVTDPTRSLKMKLKNESNRYWELMGCTTRQASESQFINGSGWFSNIKYHPNCPKNDLEKRENAYWDHGSGIKYWAKKYKTKDEKVHLIPEKYIEEGHCTRIRNSKYIPQSPNNEKRDLTKDLVHNYSIKEECKRLGLLKFIQR